MRLSCLLLCLGPGVWRLRIILLPPRPAPHLSLLHAVLASLVVCLLHTLSSTCASAAEPVIPAACIKLAPLNATTLQPLPPNTSFTQQVAATSIDTDSPSSSNTLGGNAGPSTLLSEQQLQPPANVTWRRDWSLPAKGDGCFPLLSGLSRPLAGMVLIEQALLGSNAGGQCGAKWEDTQYRYIVRWYP